MISESELKIFFDSIKEQKINIAKLEDDEFIRVRVDYNSYIIFLVGTGIFIKMGIDEFDELTKAIMKSIDKSTSKMREEIDFAHLRIAALKDELNTKELLEKENKMLKEELAKYKGEQID